MPAAQVDRLGEEIEDPAVFDIQHLGVLAAHLQQDEMVQARLLPGAQEMGPDFGDGGEIFLQEILAVAGDHQGFGLRQPQRGQAMARRPFSRRR